MSWGAKAMTLQSLGKDDSPSHTHAAVPLGEGVTPKERHVRIWFDTEFIEDGKTIDLISIGLIREDGRTYYAESAECALSKACPWVEANVFPHLTGERKNKGRIAQDIRDFAGDDPEFWAWFGSYDWVSLCQLYGRMIDLPPGWPMFVRDLRQLADGTPWRAREQRTTKHHALNDAVWTMEAHMDFERHYLVEPVPSWAR